jgi:hypothetical protein
MSDPASANPVPQDACEHFSITFLTAPPLIIFATSSSPGNPRNVARLAHGPAGSTTAASSSDTLTLRALVSTRDAGIIIGKQGKNVADLREHTGVKAGVSKVMPGVHERVLSVSGNVAGVAKVRKCL